MRSATRDAVARLRRFGRIDAEVADREQAGQFIAALGKVGVGSQCHGETEQFVDSAVTQWACEHVDKTFVGHIRTGETPEASLARVETLEPELHRAFGAVAHSLLAAVRIELARIRSEGSTDVWPMSRAVAPDIIIT